MLSEKTCKTAQKTKRISWIDMAKGYGIIFVILGHCDIGILKLWVYTFHIPLFFLLSGYVFNAKSDFKTFLIKKVKSIIIPYFCLGIPMLLFRFLVRFKSGKFTFRYAFNLTVKFILQRRQWTFWFLACLFFLNILFYVTVKVFKTNAKLTFLSIVFVIMGFAYYKYLKRPLYWNIDVCFMAYPFFFAGYFYKQKHQVIDKYLNNVKTSVPLLFLLGFVNSLFGYLSIKVSGSGLEMFLSRYGFIPFTYLSAFAGIVCVIIVSKWFTFKIIKYIGENSLLYFLWHQTIMLPLTCYFLNMLHISIKGTGCLPYKVLFAVLQVIIITAVITLCNYIISHTKLRFVLGKSNPNN